MVLRSFALSLALSLTAVAQSPTLMNWNQIDRLAQDQKLEEAAKAAEGRLDAAKKRGDEEEWTLALIRITQFRIALGGYETAVRSLKEQEWPKAPIRRAALELLYANALTAYAQAYGWEIRRRERVEAKGPVDLKAWTYDQIYEEAERAFDAVWKERAALGNTPAERLGELIEPGNYPPNVRSTLRDVVSYLFASLLSDSGAWRPDQANEVYRLDLGALLKDQPEASAKIDPADPALHPLVRMAAVLDDLQGWHSASGHREAALEARIERARQLQQHFTSDEEHARIRKDLEQRLEAYRDVPWYSAGKAAVAELFRADKDLVQARAVAEQGAKAYPRSVGGEICLSIQKQIEAPDFQMMAMQTDGPSKRSVQLRHRNIRALHFRAYAIDLDDRLARWKDYSLVPEGAELEKLIGSKKAAARWTASLPETPDFADHTTYVTPELSSPGLYLVAASAREDFGAKDNRVIGAYLLISELALTSQQGQDGSQEIRIVDGQSGKPLPGVRVELYAFDWQKGHRLVDARQTDAGGSVRWTKAPDSNNQYFVIARRGDQRAMDLQRIGFYGRTESPAEASLVYTDRSIYRPLQKIRWKVVAYQGSGARARFQVEAKRQVTVGLYDGNGEQIEQVKVKTNSFGSAAGEFLIPSGRVLGSWSVRSDPDGQAEIRVEEYKRPTFEAKFLEPEAPMRLNKPAALKGEARYYFGLPVTSGQVRWQVTRQPRFPWWWELFGNRPGREAQVIATGGGALGADGTFQVTFTPEADERLKSSEVSYDYAVSADVTDEGGETRSAERSVRLGFTAVEASIASDVRFFLEGHSVLFTVRRTDLDGNGRAGAGRAWVTRLDQPAEAVLPAEEPIPQAPSDTGYHTPGDFVRPRWISGYSPRATMRAWKDGEEIAARPLNHPQSGEAKLELAALPPGAYRLHYETKDEFGATYRTQQEFIVAGAKARLEVPLALFAETPTVKAGGTLRLFVTSGLPDQPAVLDIYRQGRPVERRLITAGADPQLVELPVTEEDRGGISLQLAGVRDYQFMSFSEMVVVPYDDKELLVEFSTFRDKLTPGAKETFRVTVKGPKGAKLENGTAELLAYMYDQSLDAFATHDPPSPLNLYQQRNLAGWVRSTLAAGGTRYIVNRDFPQVPEAPQLTPASLKFLASYGIGGMGPRGMRDGVMKRSLAMRAEMAPGAPPPEPMAQKESANAELGMGGKAKADTATRGGGEAQPPAPLRTNFAETAFFAPQLLIDASGNAAIEFTVPDSVTAWNVWAHAITRDMKGGSAKKEARSIKELMVRPYVPRFFREGDEATLEVVVNNASERELAGTLTLEITDTETNQSALADFVAAPDRAPKSFTAPAGKSAKLSFLVKAPRRVRTYAFKVVAKAGALSDGEVRPVPVLPSRVRLAQSRFATLHDKARKELRFEDMAKGGDPTLQTEQLVVTVDAQLFYSALDALPYLVNYPYECTEQTLNRFVSTGILSSLYGRYPAVAKMAQKMSKRTTELEAWNQPDPNRKMMLEESPWLEEAKGGLQKQDDLLNVLDPKISRAQRDDAMAKLQRMQTSVGAFPWFPGGPPSPFMTLYLVHGLSRAAEYKVEVPKEMTQRAWGYLAQHFRDEYSGKLGDKGCCFEFLTFLNYVASSFPDESYTGGALTMDERKKILDFSFKHWREHSPMLKGYLALTLKRMGRPEDAKKVFDSVMDSAKTTEELGTFWAPEDRSWLWYNDTIESHAFALRVLTELQPKDARRHGLVQWLLLNKKLSHWKSTRATAEVIFALVKYLEAEGALGIEEEVKVTAGGKTTDLHFAPDEFTGKKNQIVIPGDQVDPKRDSTIAVEKPTKGFAFVSATWHFSTDQLPAEERGDFFSVSRRYFRREKQGKEAVLQPLAEGAAIAPGDEVEVQLSIRAKAAAEYVHLKDPRAAGLEPENAVSGYRWDVGIAHYEETRDSATNFFFDWLPAGEYTLKYRLRANMAGTFRVGPATLQSLYAPEFNAYSAGNVMKIAGAKP